MGSLVRNPATGLERIVLDGRTIPLDPDAVTGWVDRTEPGTGGLVVAGWAVEAEAKRAARRVLVFVGSDLVRAAAPDVVREDVSALIGSAAARESGFAVEVPVRPSGGAPDPELRVFGVTADGRASELAYCVGCRRAPATRPGHGPRAS